MEDEKLLPKPQIDLPLPEKEIPARVTPQGHALQNQKPNIFKSKFFLGFVAFSILIAFLIGGFMLGRNSVFKELNPTAPVIPPKDPVIYEATPTPDPTADWKTYINPDKLYQLKYPADWTTIAEDSYGNQVISFYPAGYPFNAPGEPAKDTPYLRITVLPDVLGRGVNPIKTEQILIDGTNYRKFYESATDGVIETATAPNNKGIMINFKLPKDSGKDAIDSTFDQILSTFTFSASKFTQ